MSLYTQNNEPLLVAETSALLLTVFVDNYPEAKAAVVFAPPSILKQLYDYANGREVCYLPK